MSEAALNRSPESRLFERLDMKSAALFQAFKNEPIIRRVSRVTRMCLEQTPVPEYRGPFFYPSDRWGPSLPDDDPNGHGLKIHYTGDIFYNGAAFGKLIASTQDPFEKRLLQRLARDMGSYHINPQTSRYAHGGMHWVMNFPRLLQEGFEGYRSRVEEYLSVPEPPEKRMFHEAMLDTLEGLISLVKNCQLKLKETYQSNPTPNRKRLIAAFERVPLRPARSFYEAVTATHFMTYLGGGEPGRLDQYLYPYFSRDLAEGIIDSHDAMELLDERFATMDALEGSPGAWHLTIGGTDIHNKPAYNELTAICLRLSGRYRQPNTSLRVRNDMPDELWNIALDNLGNGRGNPAMVNDNLYMSQLPEMGGVAQEDLCDYGFGGCTETLVQGKCATDSIGSTFNLLDILEASITTHLLDVESFDDFMRAFKDDIRLTARELTTEVNLRQGCFGRYRTDPVRSLFTDDCIEIGKSYHAGGARYNFEVTVVYGIANVVNSLYTLKKLFSGELGVSRHEFLQALADDYKGHETLLAQVRSLDKFGNYQPESDALATEVTEHTFDEIRQVRCWRGNGHFLPASIGWVDFIALGKNVGATPDGRLKEEPLADSTGPTQGTDRQGPTETLLSTASVAQSKALGTCVLNLRLNRQSFETSTQRANLRAMILAYFAQGGGQLQISVVDQKILKDAILHPEKHENLIVRVAGYNDYFVKQTPEIQAEILERTIHEVGS